MPDPQVTLAIVASRHIQETEIPGVIVAEHHDNGRVKRAFVNGEHVIHTSWGDLVPQYTGDDESRRPRLAAIRLDAEGRLESLALETTQTLDTPLGPLPAELVTFHENGSLKRIFPCNGKLSAFWSWQDEYALAPEIALPLPASLLPEEADDGAAQTARYINFRLDPDGALRSATLWPGETVTLRTPVGPARARVGFALHADGSLASFEPATALAMQTPIGVIHAFDPDPEAISGDVNSLAFAPDGSVARATTVQDIIRVEQADGSTLRFAPRDAEDLCSSSMATPDDSEGMIEAPDPLTVWFENKAVSIAHGRLGASGAQPEPAAVISLDAATFHVEPVRRGLTLAPLSRSCG
ncbi:hypothetical protein [Oceanidesulfovibrio marinus]|uniref:Uncharacterized protein n=1 Tax=Oceanidesulfovibrio marinus TaxID=370038 RepID=A0A6P1ZGH5_9BACT|nr:hypothetical protein [Oceanidesulfovibrio marinus]QJT10700.1 hypothetical protein E8L03_18040 [Oceanidesulfovibrio marinus]TVM34073.1 hypothetical protein DQK91_09215 [Oceanidesulfovibrio marinus]